MKVSKSPLRLLILFAGMAALLLPAARCGQTQTNSADIQGSGIAGVGPSSDIRVVPGSGEPNWFYGKDPPGVFAQPLLDMINGHRIGLGLSPLTWHDGISLSAQNHNADMTSKGFLSIVNLDGVDLFNRLVSSSPRIDFDNAWAFVGKLTNPPGVSFAAIVYPAMLENSVTRAVMESPRTTHVGIRGNATGYFTMIFAANARP